MKHENKSGGSGLLRYRNFIAGQWQDALGGEHITLRNPSDGSDLAVAAVRAALSSEWGNLTATERGRALHRISEQVLKNIDLLTDLELKDVGKPVTQARADVVALATVSNCHSAASKGF